MSLNIELAPQQIMRIPGVPRPRIVGFKTDEIRTRVWADPQGLQWVMEGRGPNG